MTQWQAKETQGMKHFTLDTLSKDAQAVSITDYQAGNPSNVYNDALTSKSDFLTEPTLKPQHIDEFDLKDETSLSEYDEVEQIVLYFNDLFPFNIIYLDDLKSGKDNDDNKIDIIQSSGAPTHAPPLPPPPAAGRTIPYRLRRLEEEIHELHQDVRSLRGLVGRSMNDQGRFSTWMVSCMT
ncbi:hypothetical protein Tco_0676558 [Tanacetum coccineum]